MTLNIKATPVFEKNYEALFDKNERFIVNMGGSRSSKTYSLCQLVIIYALKNPHQVISIVRKTFPALRSSVMRDFFEVLNDFNLYDKNNHNKTEHTYIFPNGTVVEFFSVDNEMKVRGRKRHLLWMNEANELYFEDYQQLNMRTEHKVICDFNPSENYSWLYQLDPSNQILIKSTYKDNPFLPKSIAQQIEDLKNQDEALYTIFALGERAITKENIYSNFKFIPAKPKHLTDFIYAIDFGYSHPTALLKIWYNDNEVFIEELIYESRLTSSLLIQRMESLGIDKNIEMIADYARPEIIAELQEEGYYVINANKNVQKGINSVKTTKVNVSDKAENVNKEYMNYRYKKIRGVITEEPTKILDDAMDAIRYGIVYLKETYFNVGGGLEVFSSGLS